jgi:hypothetical protein
MKALILIIEVLERKQENGTITFEEQQKLHWAIEKFEEKLYN